MPGFIAAVNPSVHVSDGAIELYRLNYLFGFVVSAVVYYVLHLVVPERKLDEFIKDGISAKDTQQMYHERWNLPYTEGEPGSQEHIIPHNKGPNSLATSC
jgi:NCS1 family nucleobase:cation symporter-1